MTVIAYQVISGSHNPNFLYEDRFTYLWSKQAISHWYGIRKYSSQEDDYSGIDFADIESLPKQNILIFGYHIGFQFAENSMGKRRATRTVMNLRRTLRGFEGEIKFKGRLATVESTEWWAPWVTIQQKRKEESE